MEVAKNRKEKPRFKHHQAPMAIKSEALMECLRYRASESPDHVMGCNVSKVSSARQSQLLLKHSNITRAINLINVLTSIRHSRYSNHMFPQENL